MNRRELIQRAGVAGASLAFGLPGSGAEAKVHPQNPIDLSDPPPPGAKLIHDMSGYGIPAGASQHIAMLLYPKMTLLDLVGPQQIFATMGNVKVHLVWKSRELVTTDTGVVIQPTTTFTDCPNKLTALFVPGGSQGTLALMKDTNTLDFLAKQGKTARYVTSVCTGSLVLGAAGLLRGYRATSHWAVRDLLSSLGATPVKARIVEDRNRITGGGVTAGIDFGLRLTALLRNEKMAQALQLAFEYSPEPPFNAGTPKTAPPEVTQMEWAMYAPMREEMRTAAREAQARWRGTSPDESKK